MTKKAAHSPLPWQKDPEVSGWISDASGKDIIHARPDDAPLILQSVNSHPNFLELLEALTPHNISKNHVCKITRFSKCVACAVAACRKAIQP